MSSPEARSETKHQEWCATTYGMECDCSAPGGEHEPLRECLIEAIYEAGEKRNVSSHLADVVLEVLAQVSRSGDLGTCRGMGPNTERAR